MKINPSALYWASFNRFELRLSGQAVLDCSHSGKCDSDVEYWTPRIRALVNKPTPDAIRAELKECGAWDDEELADDEQNWRRLVWIAAGNIREEDEADCSEPLPTLTPSLP